MIKITVDAALKRSLDSEGRRDPLLQEIFHEGDSIAQCPACKSWMLEQSWEALGGSCACSYKHGSNDRVKMRRTTPAAAGEAATPTAPETATPTPVPPPAPRGPVPRWVLALGGLAFIASLPLLGPKLSPTVVEPPVETRPSVQPRSEPAREPPPAPLEINRQTNQDWILTVSRRRGSSESPSCELTTASRSTDGGAGRTDRTILIALKAGFATISTKGPYRLSGEVVLQVHGNAYRLKDFESTPHALKDDVNAIIGVFKDGLEARVSGPHYNGSVTTDVYSLMGFTASFDKALEACLK